MRFVRSAAAVAIAFTAAEASAQFPLLGGHAAPRQAQPDNKIYPLSEQHYLKKFPGPRVNCGPCFGFYKPAVRPWHEACGEPEPENFGPRTYAGGPSVPDLPDPPIGDRRPGDPTPLDKNGKEKEPAPVPNKGKKAEDEPGKTAAAPAALPAVTVPVLAAPVLLPPPRK